MKLVSYETNCGQKQNEVFLTNEHKSVLARDIYKKKNFLNLFMQGQLRSVESKKKKLSSILIFHVFQTILT